MTHIIMKLRELLLSAKLVHELIYRKKRSSSNTNQKIYPKPPPKALKTSKNPF
jgi:hypothetical protein